jgi:hypothetical protein
MRILNAAVLACCIFPLPLHAASATEALLICELGLGVGLNSMTGKFSPSANARRFIFRVPFLWQTSSAPEHAVAPITWVNLVRGWGGNATGILNGRMVTIVETTTSDNAFLTHIWLNKPDRSGQFEAVHVVAGHGGLPKGYDGSSLFTGRCRISGA